MRARCSPTSRRGSAPSRRTRSRARRDLSGKISVGMRVSSTREKGPRSRARSCGGPEPRRWGRARALEIICGKAGRADTRSSTAPSQVARSKGGWSRAARAKRPTSHVPSSSSTPPPHLNALAPSVHATTSQRAANARATLATSLVERWSCGPFAGGAGPAANRGNVHAVPAWRRRPARVAVLATCRSAGRIVWIILVRQWRPQKNWIRGMKLLLYRA